MKHLQTLLLTLVMLLLAYTSFCQPLNVQKLSDPKTIELLNSVRTHKRFTSKELTVSLFLVGGQSGSAQLPESDEVFDKLYFAISEYDEHPKQSLFCLSEIFGASGFKISKSDSRTIWISFYLKDKKSSRRRTAKITLESLVIE